MNTGGHLMKPRTILLAPAALLLAACAAGCFNPFRPLVGVGAASAVPAPAASSATGVIQRLRWCWVNESIGEYEELFTDDFHFVFSDVEAADNPPLLRSDELDRARHIFVDGSAAEPRAKRIDLEFSNSLRPTPDQRQGKMSPWHQQINTGVVLKAELQDQIWDVEGNVVFYVVRGDSAHLPADLLQRFGHDASHWYIEQWEDKTASGQGGTSLIRHLLDRARAGAPAPPAAPRASAGALSQGANGRSDLVPDFHGTWGGLKILYK